MAHIKRIICWLGALVLAGCSTGFQSTTGHMPLDAQAKWVLLPMANHTDTPQASLSAESMLEHLLRHRGVSTLLQYPAALSRDSLFEPTERKISEEAQKWARDQGARFALTGSVDEWRYKVGIDGEPAIGVTLKVIDLTDGRVVWTASGAKSGWSRQALSAVAQGVLKDMLSNLKLTPVKSPA